MKFHSSLQECSHVPTTNEMFTGISRDINFNDVDDFLYKELQQAIKPIIHGMTVLNSTSNEPDFHLSSSEKASIRNGIEKCLKILYDDCCAYYKHSSKEIFLQNANKVIQGFIEHTKLVIEPQPSDDFNKTEKQVYAKIKQCELIKTWDLFDLFLSDKISKDALTESEDTLDGFDDSKLDFSMFVLNDDGFIDWELSKEKWLQSSKTLITIENYLKIINEPTCIVKDVDNLAVDDDDILISEGKIQLVCKVSLAEFVKPMKSRCGHTFDDNSISAAFDTTSQRAQNQCLEGACNAKLVYPRDFKLDEEMVFRVACNKISQKKG
ncbi:uncharacterized protein HGUI_00278 [Hanseniaspora guilliermondii]|uniref:SP-RING-type domain-containing protein n=1 Tax=Hanseniaspora guilliermondii TaxID=56406 RepID=A0A1L0FEQ6_9ASCO|nr:uncharacterized protein HGUI_00278 [Hanseniaspora guilliermondii]